jgi:hypothetical protein
MNFKPKNKNCRRGLKIQTVVRGLKDKKILGNIDDVFALINEKGNK